MKFANFLREYIKSPRTIGAVAPSSNKLAEKMVEEIEFENAKCIVEYGPGIGAFTDKLVENKGRDTFLILIEYNREFYNQLILKYKDIENLLIVNDSAENINKYIKKYNLGKVDYIVSGLPFASLPKNMSDKILNETNNILKDEGLFITFQYTLFKKELIKRFFSNINYKRVFMNFPPAYVLTCCNGK